MGKPNGVLKFQVIYSCAVLALIVLYYLLESIFANPERDVFQPIDTSIILLLNAVIVCLAVWATITDNAGHLCIAFWCFAMAFLITQIKLMTCLTKSVCLETDMRFAAIQGGPQIVFLVSNCFLIRQLKQ